MSVDDLEAELSALAVPGQASSPLSPRESGGTVAIPGRSVAVAPGQKLLLAGGIALALVLAALPLALLVWMLVLIAGTAATAGGLAATRGLAETTYGAGFVLAAVGLVASVVGPLLLRFAWRKRPPSLWRRLVSSPFIVPLAFFLVACLALVPLDMGGTDVPDSLTTAALLGFWGFIVYLMPLALLLGTVAGALGLYRWAGAAPFRAGIVAGGALLLGAGSPTYLNAVGDDGSTDLEAAMDRLAELPYTDNIVDDSHLLLSGIAGQGSSGGSSNAGGGTPMGSSAFADCASHLAKTVDGFSQIDKAIVRLMQRGTAPATAEDVAYTTLLKVCERYALEGITRLDHYYSAAVVTNARYVWRGGRHFESCDFSTDSSHEPWQEPDEDAVLELIDLREAACQLGPGDRLVLELSLRGSNSDELAAALGISSAAARQRLKRARDHLASAMH